MKQTRVLLVDDEIDALRATADALETFGYEVISASSGAQAVVLFQAEQPDVVLLDLQLPDMDGVAVYRRLHSVDERVPVIFLSGFSDPELKRRACDEKNVEGYMVKPYDLGLLTAQIDNAVRRRMRVATLEGEVSTLKELATHDALTGLPNRRLLFEMLNQEHHRAMRGQTCIACLVIDVDLFKGFNDKFGHMVGDVVLQEVGRRLRAALRRQDLLARFGGEEFVVILPDTDRRATREAAERLRLSVGKEPFYLPEHGPQRVTISIGAAVVMATETTPERLIEAADEALLEAKRSGRDRTCFASRDSSLHMINS